MVHHKMVSRWLVQVAEQLPEDTSNTKACPYIAVDRLSSFVSKKSSSLTVWAYGSQVHRRHFKPFSDLNLVIFTEQDKPVDSMESQEVFDESDLPFTVDVSIWE